MSHNAREIILQRIQHSLHRKELTVEEKENILKREVPVYKNEMHSDLITQFIEKAKEVLTVVKETSSLDDVPTVISHILREEKLNPSLCISGDIPIEWGNYAALSVQKRLPKIEDQATLTRCLCGVSETGTLVLLSSDQSPTTLYFLPLIHIVLLDKKMIVGSYEEAIQLIRAKGLDSRLIHFITGPSRTADIEQTVQIGMHGPKKLYVLLLEE